MVDSYGVQVREILTGQGQEKPNFGNSSERHKIVSQMSYPDIATTALAPLPLTKTSEGKVASPYQALSQASMTYYAPSPGTRVRVQLIKEETAAEVYVISSM